MGSVPGNPNPNCALVRRAHQFADLKLTFLNIPPEKLRLVTHTHTLISPFSAECPIIVRGAKIFFLQLSARSIINYADCAQLSGGRALCFCICLCICMCIRMCICVCVFVCVCAHVYVYENVCVMYKRHT